MRNGRTLVSLAHELQRQLDTKKDLVVPSGLVHFSASDGGGTNLVIEEAGGPASYGITPLARRQLAEKLGIPYAYFERMREKQPALLGNNVNVVGKVNRPGEYIMNGPVDVMKAISMAGGTTVFADLDDIVVLRREVDGSQSAIPFDYTEVEAGRRLEQNIQLQAGDVVVVP